MAVITRHVLPNIVSPVIVLATLEIGQLILAVSGLTFLGLGAPPPTPEWGAMLYDGRTYFLSDPQLVLIPGLAISLAVLGFNLLGDGVRDALDPRVVKRLHKTVRHDVGQTLPQPLPTTAGSSRSTRSRNQIARAATSWTKFSDAEGWIIGIVGVAAADLDAEQDRPGLRPPIGRGPRKGAEGQ